MSKFTWWYYFLRCACSHHFHCPWLCSNVTAMSVIDPHSRNPKKTTSHGNEVLPQDTTHLIQDHVTNEEVRANIQQAIGPHEDLLTIIKRRKLQWYGHVSRSSGLAKNILQGTVKGGRRQGRQRRRWEDNIREWTGLEFGKSQRAVENREKWRKLVVKSSVVSQWPSRLRDWWWWWWWCRGVWHARTTQVSVSWQVKSQVKIWCTVRNTSDFTVEVYSESNEVEWVWKAEIRQNSCK